MPMGTSHRQMLQKMTICTKVRSKMAAVERGCEVRKPVGSSLPTMVQKNDSTSYEVLRQIHEMIPPELLLSLAIPRDPIFLRASEYGVPVGLLQQKPPASALIFDQLAAELEQRMKLLTPDAANEITRLMD